MKGLEANGMRYSIPLLVFLVPIAMLVVALGHMPWGYYQILRLLVAGASAWIGTAMIAGEKQGVGAAFLVLALAYNPFVPLRLGRETWEIVNVGTIVALALGFGFSRSLQRGPKPPQ